MMRRVATPVMTWWPVIVVIGGLMLWRLLVAAAVPVTQDEAYYFDWARHLAWGYFDHPPGVALLGATTRLEPGSAFVARLGGLGASFLTLLVLANFYRHCGLTDPRRLALAVLIVGTTLPGLIGSVLTTPDTALILGWALALHESERALTTTRWRWLTAGAALGLGLLGKYTLVLLAPPLLWALVRIDWRALRTVWPYLGILLMLLVFTPHLLWNAQHEWLTMRFQLGHGLSADLGVMTAVPAPLTAAERLGNVARYGLTQLALWGGLALLWLRRIEKRPASERPTVPPFPQKIRELLWVTTLFPLGFFAVIASFSAVEANWPAPYLLTAAPLLAARVEQWWRWALGAALVNLVLVSGYALHAATGTLPLPSSANRILRETHGFAELAQLVSGLDAPVVADRYQTTALLRFYQPDQPISQWQGLTRPSESLRGVIAPRVVPETVPPPFWLVTRSGTAPALTGFTNTARQQVFDCVGQSVQVALTAPCARPLHVWYLYRYE